MKKKPASLAAEAPAPARTYDVAVPAGFKIGKVITLPLLKWVPGQPKYLRFDGPIHTSKTVTTKTGAQGAVMKPAQIANVTDLSTNLQAQVIVGDVLEKRLNEEYEKASYVGKAFAITQTVIDGKRYKGYAISELVAA